MPGNPYTGTVYFLNLGLKAELGQLVIVGRVRIALQQHRSRFNIAAVHILNNLGRGQI
ncbi:hypothetical protein D3C75_1137250 [compost metagenome]